MSGVTAWYDSVAGEHVFQIVITDAELTGVKPAYTEWIGRQLMAALKVPA